MWHLGIFFKADGYEVYHVYYMQLLMPLNVCLQFLVFICVSANLLCVAEKIAHVFVPAYVCVYNMCIIILLSLIWLLPK